MAYRSDCDLEFLEKINSSDLDVLVKILVYDKDGDERVTEELTAQERYKRNSPNHHRYWDLIAAEIQCYGANTFMTIFRGGKGVLYKEILCDVCDKIKVNYNKNAATEFIEMNLLMKILTDSMEKMSPDELREIVEELDLKTTTFTTEQVAAALQIAIRMGGFASYKVALIVANAVAKFLFGRGLSFAANAALARTMAIFAGPIGWVITGLWTAIDIAGPAYRVTIPAIIQVAFLRAKLKYGQ